MKPRPYGAFLLDFDGTIDRIGGGSGLEGALDRATCMIYAFHGMLCDIERLSGREQQVLSGLLPRPAALLWHAKGSDAYVSTIASKRNADTSTLFNAFERSMRSEGYERIVAESFIRPELERLGLERLEGSYKEHTDSFTYVKPLR